MEAKKIKKRIKINKLFLYIISNLFYLTLNNLKNI